MTDWYYEENGTQRGPVKETDLATMFANRFLPIEARVWSADLGSEWTPASQTKFRDSASATPPPLPPSSDVQQGQAAATVLSPFVGQRPTPKLGTYYAEMLAYSPLAILLIDVTAKAAKVDPNASDFSNASQLWLTLATIAVCLLDVRQLNRRGLNPGKRWIAPFLLLTPIGYFWRRAAILGGGWRYLWIWLGCMLALLIGEVAFVIDV
ncbi:DUF4339 domain-containing protein [Mesorhizobium sp. B3-1-3]|uniref:DUF4339 domain-containing protein n=1 Tax=unclassified Mesorhizobium TaxID=325217 RepID=UPI00112C4EC6|nr:MULTISPECIES: DUF4339 domain-containing protein [unclassified Mesorhizobium]TPI65542.1 DUF4339 domain-containing protein [Mesorhizobium sp. B3-1-8]TPI72737.1 DUF4339 domain-containing protein [Mesorhizobium sp. B3-1-3]